MGRYLVTGGAGFIGGHLVEHLLSEGHEVHVVDDMSSAPIPYDKLCAELGDPERLTCNLEPIELFSRRGSGNIRFDGIYHLASPVGPAGILQHSGEMVRKIVDDTYAVIELALRHHCRLVFVSTSEIYGGGVNGLCAESMPCIIQSEITVRLEYAVAKLAAEIAVINTGKIESLDAVIVRPFNVTGPRQSAKGGFVLARFLNQAMAGEPLTVFGDGSQIRAFTHVRDIADGLILAMERGKRGEAYNLGNPAGKTTILDLAQVVNQMTANDGNLIFTDGKTVHGPLFAESADKYPDATKAMTELDWKPSRSIIETIGDAIAYERSKVHAA